MMGARSKYILCCLFVICITTLFVIPTALCIESDTQEAELKLYKKVIDRIEAISAENYWTLEDIMDAFIKKYGSEKAVSNLEAHTFHSFDQGKVTLSYYHGDWYYEYTVAYYDDTHKNVLYEKSYTRVVDQSDCDISKPTYWNWVIPSVYAEIVPLTATSGKKYHLYRGDGSYNRLNSYMEQDYYDSVTVSEYVVWPESEFYIAPSNSENGLKQSDDGIWRYYENDVFIEFTGVLDFEGGQFFVADGVLCSDANGLAQFDGKWYFLAAGQVQTQYTGLALYDGWWFYITDGVLDTSKKGLIPYDGSLFLVADGQILRNVSGLWYDPFDTFEWYYLADGQVVTYYTGLAEYEGAMFYVIEGRLASEYTGNVDFNGTTYRVENGQVVSGTPMLSGAPEPEIPDEEPFDEPVYTEPAVDVADVADVSDGTTTIEEQPSVEEQPAAVDQPVESVPAEQPEEETPAEQEQPAEPISELVDEAEAEDGLAAEEQPATGNDATIVEDQPLVEISMSETIIEEPVTENDEAEEAPEEPVSDIILPAIEELIDEVAPAA